MRSLALSANTSAANRLAAWHVAALSMLLSMLLPTACSSKSADPAPIANALAEGLGAATRVLDADPQPILCAAPSVEPPQDRKAAVLVGGQIATADGRLSIVLDEGRAARVAFVADARGASPRTLQTIEKLVSVWESSDVSVVVVLGGMAQDKQTLDRLLSVMASPRRAVVAVPGDRESFAALEESVTGLRVRGLPVFSVTEARMISVAGATVGLLPGVASDSVLVAGGDGCLHREEDAAGLAASLSKAPTPRIWASYAAPRQREHTAQASDLSDGVHAGEPELTKAVRAAKPQLVVHGQIEPLRAAAENGVFSNEATTTQFVAVGAIEDLPTLAGTKASPSAAVVVTIESSRVEWKRLTPN